VTLTVQLFIVAALVWSVVSACGVRRVSSPRTINAVRRDVVVRPRKRRAS
jgi:hypothetical protein